ncbi:ankyrin repeat and MYND domain-containing protein 2-like [Babylonia areolata]|uniref:ankyrin repeat and MYND domain-containing protein 2-like n=1 Tax=Babylonia areolata TaxID=304850 RepID=UPI003FD047CB
MAPKKGELSESEQKLMDAVEKGTTQDIASLLKEPDVHIDCLDQTGMTPLQHACFKGRADVCRFLLDNGANVNAYFHENGYSTLHFCALSGNVEVTNMMLEAGAKTDQTNSVNRTAAQMGAFVGQHQCVRAINNFFPRYELETYTVAQGFEKEPKLPPSLLTPLLMLINMTNLNPVKVALYLKENRELVLESYKVGKVLDLIVEKNMKARDTNDMQAIKCHYYAAIIRLASKSMKDSEDTLDGFVKSFVKGREEDGFPEKQDRLIRQALKEFPYPESQLLQNLVRQIAPVKIGEGSSALSVMVAGLYGPTFEDDNACTTCGEPKATKTCSACKYTNYCSQSCQKLHWSTHKKFCKKIGEEYQKRLKEEEEQKKKRAEMEAKMKEAQLTDKEGEKGDGQATEEQKDGVPESEEKKEGVSESGENGVNDS